jgi:Tfp pilus assembly protein PilN
MPVIKVNLLPSAQKQPIIVFDRGLAIGIGVLALELIAILAFAAIMNQRISALNDQIQSEEQQLQIVQAQVKEVDDLRDQVQQLAAKADLLERIKQSPIQDAEILTDLADNTPGGVWFTNVTLNHPADGGSVALEGKTSTYREVADLMLNLDSSPMFGNATLTTTRTSQGQENVGGGNVSFTMASDLSPAVIGQQGQ